MVYTFHVSLMLDVLRSLTLLAAFLFKEKASQQAVSVNK